MTSFVLVAVGLLSILVLLDLTLTFAIIRRLRVHTGKLDELEKTFQPQLGLAVGEVVPDFETSTITGESVTRELLVRRGGVVAFLSTQCDACREQAPALEAYLRASQAAGGSALVVVTTDNGESAVDLVGPVYEKVSVVTEADQGPVQRAFQVTAYPCIFLISPEGTVAAAAFRVEDLPAQAAPELA